MAGPSGNETNHTMDGLTIRGGLALVGAGGATTYLNSDVAAFAARQAVLMRGQGVFAEAFSSQLISAQTLATTQAVYGMAVGLLAGDVVTNLTVRVAVGGNTVTLVKTGLYSKAGTLLASSASDGAGFASAGVKTMAMTTPYTVLTDDLYYAAFIAVSAVTMPTMFRSANFGVSANGVSGVGAGSANLVSQTGQADLPASATWTASAGYSMWIGAS